MVAEKTNPIDLRAVLKGTGLRVTAARLEVLGLLCAASKPLSHGEVVARLHAAPWDRATLYRNLIDLTEASLLRRVSFGSTWYFEPCFQEDAAPEKHTHPHFVCTACGLVQCAHDVQMTIHAGKKSTGAIRKGQVQIQLHGLCDACT